VLTAAGLLAGAPPLFEYATHHAVRSVPLAVLAALAFVLAFLSLALGLLLNSVNVRLLELETLIQARLGPRPGGSSQDRPS
jgi:hypothetical protein